VQKHDCQGRTDERCRREIRTCAGSPEIAKPENEQNKAHAITEEPQDRRGAHLRERWKMRPNQQGKNHIGCTGDQAFDHGDLHRVGRTELRCEIVIHAPGNTRANDGNRAQSDALSLTAPREENRSCQDCSSAEQQAMIDILSEHDPCNSHRCETFQIQEERRSGSWCRCEADHQKNRTDDAAAQDHQGEPCKMLRLIDASVFLTPNARRPRATSPIRYRNRDTGDPRGARDSGRYRAGVLRMACSRQTGLPRQLPTERPAKASILLK